MPVEASPKNLPAMFGDYERLEKIADGGMGSVYKGRHRESGEQVAIKVLPPNMANNSVLLQRFEQEFQAASKLEHPNLVRALHRGIESGTPYLIMEYVEGETLGQRIERGGRLPEAEAIRIMAQIAQGLHKAHKTGMIHRDVKPDNIIIQPDGVAKLADMGLVKEIETDLNLTKTGRGLGTPHFMAPEQFRNAKNADIRCDIYSLGATLYMAVTGELPFKALSPLDAWMRKMQNELPHPRHLVSTLNERLDWAIRRSMSADPELRPATCREFVEDLTGRSTRKLPTTSGDNKPLDLWYLVYTDEQGQAHTVKGSLFAIRKSLKDGLLGDAEGIRISRGKEGPFEPIRNQPEFRDLLIQPAALPTKVTGDTAKTPVAARGSLAPPPLPRANASPNYKLPSIDIGATKASGGFDWITWMLLIFVAIGAFLVGFYFLFIKK